MIVSCSCSSIDDLVSDIVEQEAEEISAEEISDDNDEDRGPILRRPHQFGKLASKEAEDKNITCFLSNPHKVH